MTQTKTMRLPASWPDFQNSGTSMPTGLLTLNTSEFRNGAIASSLSDILETGAVPQRYFLTSTACRGILRRAERRGKNLPEALRQALLAVSEGGASGDGVTTEPGMKQQCYIAVGLDEEQNATVDGMGCLKARREGGGFEGSVMTPAMRVRRLLPVECARLQSVPDTHLDILYRGKPLADGPKYKLLGNGFCINVVKWIGERIQQVENLHNK
jgi:site-specific DNA-cytosine methylase